MFLYYKNGSCLITLDNPTVTNDEVILESVKEVEDLCCFYLRYRSTVEYCVNSPQDSLFNINLDERTPTYVSFKSINYLLNYLISVLALSCVLLLIIYKCITNIYHSKWNSERIYFKNRKLLKRKLEQREENLQLARLEAIQQHREKNQEIDFI